MAMFVNTCFNAAELAAFKRAREADGSPIIDFGKYGFAIEQNGEQVFRAARASDDWYDVRYCERTYPNV